jgi:predicted negative regulator of RcsB-dependent stress response
VINYETDEQKVEAIKKWWKENGVSVVAGIVIGLAAIFGWHEWNKYQDSIRQQASAAFEQLLVSTDKGEIQSALAQSKLLEKEFSSTTYATLASLAQGRIQLQAGNIAGTRAALEEAIAGSPDPGLTRIAALRLVRVLIAEGDLQAASDLIAKYDDGGSFAGAFAAARGDIAQAQGRTAEARAAYEKAIATGAPGADRLRLKLEDLTSTPESQAPDA